MRPSIQIHQKEHKAEVGRCWQPCRSIPTPKPVGPVLEEAHVGPANTPQPQLELRVVVSRGSSWRKLPATIVGFSLWEQQHKSHVGLLALESWV